MRSDIAPGRRFPDYVLPDHTNTERRLSELQGDDLLLLVLIRGAFCPKDREQLKELTRFHPQLTVGYCRLVVITADGWHATNDLRQQLGAHYPFLYDEHHRVRDDLDILEYTDAKHQPMIPHTLLLAPQLQIRRIWNGYYYWGRPSVAELQGELRELTRDIRADWDLASPGLKEQWEAGDKRSFYPYGSQSRERPMKEKTGDLRIGEQG